MKPTLPHAIVKMVVLKRKRYVHNYVRIFMAVNYRDAIRILVNPGPICQLFHIKKGKRIVESRWCLPAGSVERAVCTWATIS